VCSSDLQEEARGVAERLELVGQVRELRLLLGEEALGVDAVADVVDTVEVEVEAPLRGEEQRDDDEAPALLLGLAERLGGALEADEVLLRQRRQEVARGGDLGLELAGGGLGISEEHTSELQSREKIVCSPLLEKKQPGS